MDENAIDRQCPDAGHVRPHPGCCGLPRWRPRIHRAGRQDSGYQLRSPNSIKPDRIALGIPVSTIDTTKPTHSPRRHRLPTVERRPRSRHLHHKQIQALRRLALRPPPRTKRPRYLVPADPACIPIHAHLDPDRHARRSQGARTGE